MIPTATVHYLQIMAVNQADKFNASIRKDNYIGQHEKREIRHSTFACPRNSQRMVCICVSEFDRACSGTQACERDKGRFCVSCHIYIYIFFQCA